MAKSAVSNNQPGQMSRRIRKSPFRTSGEAEVRVAVVRAAVAKEPEPADRDGLVWLGQKRRLTSDQLKAAFRYRDWVRDAGDVSVKSALDVGVGGGGYGPGEPSPIISLTTARRELLVVRWRVLRGQPDMLTVMDGVCGAGHTLRGLAGGDKHRARDLEVLLKAALDLLAAFLREPVGEGA